MNQGEVSQLQGGVRCQQSWGAVLAQLLFGPLFVLGPLALGIWYLVSEGTSPLVFLFLAGGIGFSAFTSYHILPAYHWVELDGDIIRGRRFWFRFLVERRIHDIVEIVPLRRMVQTAETALLDLLKASHAGCEIRFKQGGSTITIITTDMTNAHQVVNAIFERLETLGKKGTGVFSVAGYSDGRKDPRPLF